jgi:hypothetical protein
MSHFHFIVPRSSLLIGLLLNVLNHYPTMKKVLSFSATCLLFLFASATPSLAQASTPPPVSTPCASDDYNCWANTGYARSQAAALGNETLWEDAVAYAEHYRARGQSSTGIINDYLLTLYWDYYCDGAGLWDLHILSFNFFSENVTRHA